MDSKDKELDIIIDNLRQLSQRQCSLLKQLLYLEIIAIKFGLYDASDYIKNITEKY